MLQNELVATSGEQEIKKSKILSLMETHILTPLKEYFSKSESAGTSPKQVYADTIIRNSKGQVLLLHRTYTDDFMNGTWGLPGGKVEPGEEPAAGAVRECFEETGLTFSTPPTPLVVKHKEDCVIHYYGAVAPNVVDASIVLDVEEHRGWAWVDVEKLQEYNLILDLGTYLPQLIEQTPFQGSVEQMPSSIEEAIAKSKVDEIEEQWEIIQKAFDEDQISAEEYLKAMKQKDTLLLEEHFATIEKAFDEGQVSIAEYAFAYELVKGKGAPAAIGEKRMFAGRMHIKTADGWVYYGKGRGTKARSHEKAIKDIYKPASPGSRSKMGVTKPSLGIYEKLDHASRVSAGGSGGAYIYKVKDDSFWADKVVVKEKYGEKNTPEHLAMETAVDQIYNTLGFSASMSTLETLEDGSVVKIATFIDSAKELGAVGPVQYAKARGELRKGFVLDCLLLNWDVIGAGMDNILVTSDGNPIRIDNGGSLLYRAKAGLKSESSLVAKVSELEVMVSDKNPSGKKIFGGITSEEIAAQTKQILEKKSDILSIIDKTPHMSDATRTKVKQLLESRMKWLEEEYVMKKVVKKETHSYPSDITNNYFKDWDSLDFQGNPGIKDAIKEQIIRIEKANDAHYRFFAEKRGISVEEYKGLLQSRIENLINKSDFFRATDIGVLDKVLHESKRFKSQFETGTSHGFLSPSSRARTELQYFGYPNDVKHQPEKRPIYGYFSDNSNGVINSKGSIPPPNYVSPYGQVTIKFHKEKVLNKTTITFQDSLGAENVVAATPANKPHFTSLSISSSRDPLTEFERISSGLNQYVEAQFHNQLTLEDMQCVKVSPYANAYSKDPESADYDLINKVIEVARLTNLPVEIFGHS